MWHEITFTIVRTSNFFKIKFKFKIINSQASLMLVIAARNKKVKNNFIFAKILIPILEQSPLKWEVCTIANATHSILLDCFLQNFCYVRLLWQLFHFGLPRRIKQRQNIVFVEVSFNNLVNLKVFCYAQVVSDGYLKKT